MELHYYKGRKVEMVRMWETTTQSGQRKFVDLRDPRNGELYSGVPLEYLEEDSIDEVEPQQNLEPVEVVRFAKDKKVVTFEKDSDEYKKFVVDNKLNEAMIENCLNGVMKTHKGFKISKM